MAESAEGICKSSGTDPFHNQLSDASEAKLHGPGVYHWNCDFPGTVHIDGEKDFTPVIQRALELGGYEEDQQFTESMAALP